MAWIHPETNGDYRIMGVTTNTGNAVSPYESVYNTFINADIVANAPDMNALGMTDWFIVGSTYEDGYGPPATEIMAKHKTPAFTHAVYNTMGSKLWNNHFGMWGTDRGSAPLTSISYTLAGVLHNAAVWTGDDNEGQNWNGWALGEGDCSAGNSGIAGANANGWMQYVPNYGFENPSNIKPYYGMSTPISTVSGSLSGTVTRESSTIWAIGAITLTADVDFGGTVNLRLALDASQLPTITGDFVIDVGTGGTVTDIPVKIKDSGTGNLFIGNVGSGIQVRN